MPKWASLQINLIYFKSFKLSLQLTQFFTFISIRDNNLSLA